MISILFSKKPIKRIRFISFVILYFGTFGYAGAQSIVINEVSQGTGGSQEYVEFLVTGPALINCDDVPPCIDLRGYIFDDNNGYLNGTPTSGVGIASGACRFSNDVFWSCIPAGTVIVIYNDADLNGSVPPQDLSMADANCTLVVPISSALFERHNTLPSSSDGSYPTTGWISGGSWTPISMANTADGFQIYEPANTTIPVFSVGWGSANSLGDIYMGSGSAAGNVFYANDCNYFNQASWVDGNASSDQTPGSFNQNQSSCAGLMNANCSPPVITLNPVDETCSGYCDGAITATVSGGTSPFLLTWSPAPGSGQGTLNAGGLCPANYTLTLVNDNGLGCTISENATVNAGPLCCALSVTENFDNETCDGLNDGTITLTSSGGIGTVNYSIDGGVTQTTNGSFIGLSPGSYDVFVEDGSGCTYSSTIVISAGPLPAVPTFVAVGSICSGDFLAPLLSTSLEGITGSWSPAIDNLNTTSYNFLADPGQCASSTSMTIVVNQTYSFVENISVCEGQTYFFPDGSFQLITTDVTHLSLLNTLAGCDSVITTNVSAVTSYLINETMMICEGEDYTFPDGTTHFNILADEIYQSTLVSISGCDSIVETEISVQSDQLINENVLICEGNDYVFPDGTVHTNILADETHTSFLFSISGCDSTVVTNLTVTPDYVINEVVTVCENSNYTFPDGTMQLILAPTNYVSNLISSSGCDSIITTQVNVSGTFSSLLTASVCENEVYFLPDGTFMNITADITLTTTLTSLNGCDSIITTEITMLPEYNANEVVTICAGENVTFPDGTTHLNVLSDESYTSTFTTVNGCDSIIVTSVDVDPIPSVNAGADVVVCEGEQVTLNGSGANSYNWSGGILNGIPFLPHSDFEIFTLTGTSLSGCVGTDEVIVEIAHEIVPNFITDEIIGCAPLTVIFSNLTLGSGSCNWLANGNSISNDCADFMYTFYQSGTYSIDLHVEDVHGCDYSLSLVDYITVENSPVASISANRYELNLPDTEVQFYNNSSGATWYEWSFGDGQFSSAEEPLHIYPDNLNATNYNVTLVAGIDANCTDTAGLFINVIEQQIFYVPNVFTPDGDAFNEIFFPVFVSGFDPFDYHLSIFNRWGEVMFESYNSTVGWNGTYADNGLVQDDVYVWRIEFKDGQSDKRYVFYGHVTVLK